MFGKKTFKALLKEYEELNDLQVFEPLKADDLSYDHKRNALNAIELIKQKQCGKIKRRNVADCRRQRELFTKAEVSSPALSLKGFLATHVVDEQEE